MKVNIKSLIDDVQCYETVRELRWPEIRECPFCDSINTIKKGYDDREYAKKRYECKECGKRFDDLTGTIFAGHHQPLKVWILCLYFMGLNLSNNQISKALNLNSGDVHNMADQLREGVVKKPRRTLQDEVECDEGYIVAGHKGNPEAVSKKGRDGRRNRLKGAGGRGALEKEKPSIFGMI
ncbi:MAG: transposase [Desulfobacterales bacterium]|nr:transposase [Desulfobacterales bacterium]